MRRAAFVGMAGAVGLLAIWIGCGEPPGVRQVERALGEMAGENWVRAKTLLEQAIHARPGSRDNAEAYNYLGVVCARLEEIEEAISAFEEASRLQPRIWEPVYNRGVLLYRLGEWGQAADVFEEASRLDETDVYALEFRAKALQEMGNLNGAQAALQAALMRRADDPRLLTALALLSQDIPGCEDAEAYLVRALKQDPRYAAALYHFGVLRARTNDMTGAVELLNRFLAGRPGGSEAENAERIIKTHRAQEALARERVLAATAAERQARLVKEGNRTALAHKRQAEQRTQDVQTVQMRAAHIPAPEPPPADKVVPEATPEPTPIPSPRIPAPPENAVPMGPSGRLELQLAQAERALAVGDEAAAWRVLAASASAAHARGETARQIEVLDRAVRRLPNQPAAHRAYGQALFSQGAAEAALESFQAVVRLEPGSVEDLRWLARAADAAGQSDTAVLSLRRVIELDPTSADDLWDLAEIYELRIELPMRAVTVYEEFIRQFPHDTRVPEARRRLALLAPVQGRELVTAPVASESETASSKELERPTEREPDSVRSDRAVSAERLPREAAQAYNQGARYQAEGQWDAAIEAYRTALALEPHFALTWFNLGSVYQATADHAAAREAYMHALSLDSALSAARYNLALSLFALEDYSAARAMAEALLADEPQSAQVHYLMGLILMHPPADPPAAAQHYGIFLHLAPQDPNAQLVRLWLRDHGFDW